MSIHMFLRKNYLSISSSTHLIWLLLYVYERKNTQHNLHSAERSLLVLRDSVDVDNFCRFEQRSEVSQFFLLSSLLFSYTSLRIWD